MGVGAGDSLYEFLLLVQGHGQHQQVLPQVFPEFRDLFLHLFQDSLEDGHLGAGKQRLGLFVVRSNLVVLVLQIQRQLTLRSPPI